MSMSKSFWSELDDYQCPCKGSGWAQVSGESWEDCSIHFQGQLHPESKLLLLDDSKKLQEEERRAHLRWKITKSKDRINVLQSQLNLEKKMLAQSELELINKTPTTKMKAVNVTALHLDLDFDWDIKSIPPGT